jgi:hypothetical protein
MIKIEVITSDCKIWNTQDILLDLWQQEDKSHVVFDLRAEGPCCESCGLDDFLDQLVARGFIEPSCIEIHTSNQVPSSKYKEVKTVFVELGQSRLLAHSLVPVTAPMTKKFGIFIGRPNWKRLGLASYLWNEYGESTVMSYHFDPELDYFRDNFGLEEYLRSNWQDKSVYNFLQNLPIKFENHRYPIHWHERAFDLGSHYAEFFCDIICETYFTGNTFFVTEKTWRAIINRRPFIVQGPQWYLENLRRLGFRTFSDWWAEGYDEDMHGGTWDSIKCSIDHIGAQSYDTVLQWYQEMQPVLEHNIQTLKNLTDQKILTTTFRHGND